jgi:hypothetical protein
MKTDFKPLPPGLEEQLRKIAAGWDNHMAAVAADVAAANAAELEKKKSLKRKRERIRRLKRQTAKLQDRRLTWDVVPGFNQALERLYPPRRHPGRPRKYLPMILLAIIWVDTGMSVTDAAYHVVRLLRKWKHPDVPSSLMSLQSQLSLQSQWSQWGKRTIGVLVKMEKEREMRRRTPPR